MSLAPILAFVTFLMAMSIFGVIGYSIDIVKNKDFTNTDKIKNLIFSVVACLFLICSSVGIITMHVLDGKDNKVEMNN
jgi:hypothetical protein